MDSSTFSFQDLQKKNHFIRRYFRRICTCNSEYTVTFSRQIAICNSKFRVLTSFSDGLPKMTEFAAFFSPMLSAAAVQRWFTSQPHARCILLRELGVANGIGLYINTKVRLLKLVSQKLQHFGVITHLFRQNWGHSSRFVLYSSI